MTNVTFALCFLITGIPALSRRDRSQFPECQKENITFVNDMQVSRVHVGLGEDCSLSVNISRCTDPDNEVEGHVTSIHQTETTIEIENIEVFYGSGVIVTVDDICDDCEQRFFIPDMKPTENKLITRNFTGRIIDDLSNDYGCDFGSPVIDYKICIRSQGCFATPCGNDQIFTSFCNQSYPSGQRIGLEVSRVERDTVVCIFCSRIDCRGLFSNVMLFNIGITVVCDDCNENAECIEGKCVCKENYTGDGTLCEQVTVRCEMCADNAECIEGKCVCKKNYTGDGYILCVKQEDITLEVPTLPGSVSLHFGSSLPVHTSHVTTVGSSPQGFYHQNIIVGVSTATTTLVFLFIILGIVVWMYCQWKKKGVLFCLHMYLFFFNLCIFNFQE
ncbi:hypothetical protein GBAR_LOCUS8491 [Geodia barretti]|uniref:EGF-like domain-containing protein n=1 Tax=Geodia barretti TaxID=519541 RepID=A0AA35RKS8_GEOBA|nr:hypothetical protein GBAR_LOCUS8491 [Geodia barretti]